MKYRNPIRFKHMIPCYCGNLKHSVLLFTFRFCMTITMGINFDAILSMNGDQKGTNNEFASYLKMNNWIIYPEYLNLEHRCNVWIEVYKRVLSFQHLVQVRIFSQFYFSIKWPVLGGGFGTNPYMLISYLKFSIVSRVLQFSFAFPHYNLSQFAITLNQYVPCCITSSLFHFRPLHHYC